MTAEVIVQAADRLARVYRNNGMPCEIEAGPVGLVVYASTARDASVVADNVVKCLKPRDPNVSREDVVHDKDEGFATRFICTVRIDWDRI